MPAANSEDFPVEAPPRAPRWHTAALVTLIVLVAATGTFLSSKGPAPALTTPPPGERLLALYAPLLVVEWGLLFYVCRIGRSRSALSAMLGVRWRSVGRAAGDVFLAVVTGCAIVAVNVAYTHLLRMGPIASVTAMLPGTAVERAAWVAVAVSAGFCEEVVYRGYLQNELAAWTGSMTLGVILQATAFALAHADRGILATPPLVIHGILLGVLARFRKSLLPGIICHVGVDLAAGLLHH